LTVHHGSYRGEIVSDQFSKLEELTEKLAKAESIIHSISRIQSMYITNRPKKEVFDALLVILLRETESEYGFIGEIKNDADTGAPYLKTFAITNIAWNKETQKFYEENIVNGLEFRNLETLFGKTIKTGEIVIANDPKNHPDSAGIPKGHPPLNCYLGVPLIANNDMVGMFGVANKGAEYDTALIDRLAPVINAISQLVYAQRQKEMGAQ